MQQQSSIPINQLAMLRLSSPAHHQSATGEQLPLDGSIKKPLHLSPENTSMAKRSICSYSSGLEEPFPKRVATIDRSDQETPALLPPPPLYSGGSASSRNDIITPSKKPPLPPPLSRTLSDPTATSMRLKRMTEGMREMSQWCNHMIHQEEDATTASQENNNLKEKNKGETPAACDYEEAVCVDRRGDCPVLDHHFEGFVKLPLFQETPAKKMLPPPPPLYRTYSDPTGGSARSNYYKRNSPQKIITPSPSPAKKPPLPSPLSRTLSTPTQLQDSPTATSMRLKRMKEGMREMSQWCNHMIHQEEDVVSQENNNLKEENERVTPSACDCEEAVWVDRRGECLVLHFKCPCGKGYEILLLGNNCYYKLD